MARSPAAEPNTLPEAIAALRAAARARSATSPGSDARVRAEAEEWRLGQLVWTLGQADASLVEESVWPDDWPHMTPSSRPDT